MTSAGTSRSPEGFAITHKVLLATTSNPSVHVKKTRALFLGLEAIFTILLRGIHAADGYAETATTCPWPQNQFAYTRLCTHSSLSEPVPGPSVMSPRAFMSLMQTRRMRINMQNRVRRARKPNFKEYHRQWQCPIRKRLTGRARRRENKPLKLHYWRPCDFVASGRSELLKHRLGRRHARNTDTVESLPEFRCVTCDFAHTEQCLKDHKSTEARIEKTGGDLFACRFECKPCGFVTKWPRPLKEYERSMRHVETCGSISCP